MQIKRNWLDNCSDMTNKFLLKINAKVYANTKKAHNMGNGAVNRNNTKVTNTLKLSK